MKAKGLRLRGRMLFMIFGALSAITVVICVMVVVTLKAKQKEDIEVFRNEEFARIKNDLKNYVDIAYETIDANYRLAQDKKYIEHQYGPRLTDLVDVAESVIREHQALVSSGILSLAEAQSRAAEAIGKMRYDDGSGYFWINDTTLPYPKMVMHPTVPALNGAVLDAEKYNCAMGVKKNLFQAMVEETAATGEGFVDYLWPKATKEGVSSGEYPKLSYVRLIKEWNWIVGTGIYVDDAMDSALEKSKRDIEKMRYDGGAGYFWINDTTLPYPKMVMHPTVPALNGTVLDAEKYNCAMGVRKNLFQAMVEETAATGEGFVDYLWPKATSTGVTSEDYPKLSYVRRHPQLNWIVGTGVYIDGIEAVMAAKAGAADRAVNTILFRIFLVSVAAFFLFVLILNYFLTRSIFRPVEEAVALAKAIADGDFNRTMTIRGNDEISQLGRALVLMSEKLQASRQEIERKVSEMSQVIEQVGEAADQIAMGANQVSDASQNIARGASEQATSLETMEKSLSELASQTRLNAEHAGQVNGLVVKTRDLAQNGNDQMQGMVTAMHEINNAGQSISKIIKVIDEIAFQTNLLSLNAAVEAARAGRHGKGFAVVAEEVRSLAGRSALAAQETTKLIEGTVTKTKNGSELAEITASALKSIVSEVIQVSTLVAEIASASSEQARQITEVKNGLEKIALITREKNELVGETAAVAEELSGQTQELRHIVQLRTQQEKKMLC